MSDILVRRARTRPRRRSHKGGIHYWNVYDFRGPKVFIRQYTFSFHGAALNAAIALSKGEGINPAALFAVQRIEHGSMQDPRRDEEYCGRGVCAKMSGHPGRCGV
ncbi:hypothetical protein HOT72_gp085 [Gordonia phage Apricot]|uniref:Uncharacterized protein n=1 Tax=Gordonia phage Apricot TaxID=2250319 RepID=A0A345L192_9CAUD|nr:hypothetical protein HOT72_gp085 [Gordonia phage Apricot]AXH49044.1 hypothetical protein SEA_APRICOT_85 [Gordonia phage Apricot]